MLVGTISEAVDLFNNCRCQACEGRLIHQGGSQSEQDRVVVFGVCRDCSKTSRLTFSLGKQEKQKKLGRVYFNVGREHVMERLAGYSIEEARTALKCFVPEGVAIVNGEPVKENYILCKGDVVLYLPG